MTDDQEIQQHDEEFVNQKVTELMKFFDACQVFVTRCEPDGRTMAYSAGRGNFYARIGLIQEWCSRGADAICDCPPEEPEEGEGDSPSQET